MRKVINSNALRSDASAATVAHSSTLYQLVQTHTACPREITSAAENLVHAVFAANHRFEISNCKARLLHPEFALLG
jgi:hypothetical protein